MSTEAGARTDWGRPAGYTCVDALRVVGAGREEVEELGGRIFAGRRAFLVGSLAAGVGNPGSDIDAHVFSTDGAAVGLMELFLRGRPIEVQQFDEAIPRALMAGFEVNARVIRLGIGPCTVGGEAPARATQRRMAHWLYALPLRPEEHTDRVFTEAESHMAHAVLVRGALEETMLCAATAHLADQTGDPAAPYTWRRAGRWLLEAVVRGAGELFVAEKWLPKRLARSGLDESVGRDLYGITDAAGYRAALDRLGLGALDPLTTVRLSVPPDAEPVKVGTAEMLLLSKTRLVLRSGVQPAMLGAAVDAHGPRAILAALADQELIPRVDPTGLDAVLHDQP